jgi:hypothetical protein
MKPWIANMFTKEDTIIVTDPALKSALEKAMIAGGMRKRDDMFFGFSHELLPPAIVMPEGLKIWKMFLLSSLGFSEIWNVLEDEAERKLLRDFIFSFDPDLLTMTVWASLEPKVGQP